MTAKRAGLVTILARILFGLYGWVVVFFCALFALLAVLLVPGEERRHRLAAAATRAIFILAGVPLEIRGLDNVPAPEGMALSLHRSERIYHRYYRTGSLNENRASRLLADDTEDDHAPTDPSKP